MSVKRAPLRLFAAVTPENVFLGSAHRTPHEAWEAVRFYQDENDGSPWSLGQAIFWYEKKQAEGWKVVRVFAEENVDE